MRNTVTEMLDRDASVHPSSSGFSVVNGSSGFESGCGGDPDPIQIHGCLESQDYQLLEEIRRGKRCYWW